MVNINNSMRLQTLIEGKDKLTLIDLPFDEGKLKPVMDADTVRYHYHVLSNGYVDRFNKGEGDPEFNKAGAMLHNLFWESLQEPTKNNVPKKEVSELINKKFGSFTEFQDEFLEEAKKIQGSGWVYLSKSGEIKIIHNHKWKTDIVMLCDWWEHSANAQEERKDMLKGFWSIINWDIVNTRLV